MNISYNWLKEYVDFDLTPQEVADALTSEGLEVDALEEKETIKGGLNGLYVGLVTSCEPHPNSDHMHICQVDLGNGNVQQIVCGANNVAAGQKVIVATIGTKLYDGDECFTIKKSKLRGIESFGMICAEDEIGIGTSHEGIITLPEDTQVGLSAKEYYNIKSDYLIEVDITPNRSDACSHYGVARDLYAWLIRQGKKTELRPNDVSKFKVDNHNLEIDVKVENEEACPRYCAISLTNCDIKESPDWLKNKLLSIDIRPINNVVDITNYIMFAYGQPLHCYDADLVKGNQIIVKTPTDDKPFQTLDGIERKLDKKDLVICNANEPMCIAGILGGKGSGTYNTTKNIVLESAYFHPTWIRKSARRQGLNTDASFRFERGIDPNGQISALKKAAMLIKELTGGEISMDIFSSSTTEVPPFKIELDYQYTKGLIGKDIDTEIIKSIVKSLDMTITNETPNGISLNIPPYRVDVQRPCDVVEDILRIYGYNNVEIPKSVKSSLSIKGYEDQKNKLENIIAEELIGSGFNEILNNSLTKSAYYDNLESFTPETLVRLINPLSADLDVLRQTLLFGGLESMSHNEHRKNKNLRFFEFGNCYHYNSKQEKSENTPTKAYSEEPHLGIWIMGKKIEGSWLSKDTESSVFELKAYVENIIKRVGANNLGLKLETLSSDLFENAIKVTDKNHNIIAEYGIIRKNVLKNFELQTEVYYANIYWDNLIKISSKGKMSFSEISKYPPVSRDLALLIDKSVNFAQIEEIAFQTEKKLLKKVSLFDVYEGKNIDSSKKSYAVNFILQDETKTLTDKQIEKIMNNLIRNYQEKINATIR